MNFLKTMNRMPLLLGRKSVSVRAFKLSLVACFDQSWPQVAVVSLSFLEFLGQTAAQRADIATHAMELSAGTLSKNDTIDPRSSRPLPDNDSFA